MTTTGAREEWRPVVGHEGQYEVSSLGRVRSLPRVTLRRGGRPLPLKGKILKTHTDRKGYVRVSTQRIERKVHRLVCSAFHGPSPEGKTQVRHLDGNPSNNKPGNLCWGSAKENSADTIRMGRNRNQAKTHCPKGHPYPNYTPGNARPCSECRQERKRHGGHPDPTAHGKIGTYLNWSCRCGPCRDVFSEYQKNYRGRRKS